MSSNINKNYSINEWKQIGATAATPSSGNSIIYPKSNGNWYYKNSDGVEKILSLSYNISNNGFTYSSLTNSYNYNLALNIDGSTLTFSNTKLKIGNLTASAISVGGATAGYLLSVNSSGTPIWIENASVGSFGEANYIPAFVGSSTLTNSNIYDAGDDGILVGTTSASIIGSQLFVDGTIDTNALYLQSSPATYISSNSSKITLNSVGLEVTDGTIDYINSVKDLTNGNYIGLINDLIRITSTGSSNFTSSIAIPNIKTIHIGTASGTHLVHIFATQSALRLQDGSEGSGKVLSSDANGVATWVSSSSLSVTLLTNSGLTSSGSGLGIKLSPNNGLTLSNTGLSLLPSIANSGLTYSGGSFSVTVSGGGGTVSAGNGITASSGVYSIYLNNNSGLTFSAGKIQLNYNLFNSGLTYSGGSVSVTSIAASIVGKQNYIPYYGTTISLTSSSIYQTSGNILIGTTSNVGSLLYVNGTFSFVYDGLINGLNIGRGGSTTNIRLGRDALDAVSAGDYNVAIGDNALILNNSGDDNVAIGYNAASNNTGGNHNIAIGSYAMFSVNSTNVVAVGYYAGYLSGADSVYIGAGAGANSPGSYNVSLGVNSGYNTKGSYNIFLGYGSGFSFTGSYSVIIGNYSPSQSNVENAVYISSGQNDLRIYSPSSGNILLGTMSDNGSLLQVAGSMSIITSTSSNSFRLKDGSEGNRKVLMSDTNGYGQWKAFKYAATQSFTAGIPSVITHALNTEMYSIHLYDYSTGSEILGDYTSRTSTQVTIRLNASVPNCGIVIIG